MARVVLSNAGTAGPQGPQGDPGINANLLGDWNSGTTYNFDGAGGRPDAVVGSDSAWYYSLTDGNVGHDPTTDGGVHWARGIPLSVVNAGSGSPAKGNAAHADGAGSWSWRREKINVLDYGAAPDNTTDLAPAFDAACAAAVYNISTLASGVISAFAANGMAATVYIPAGVYYSSRSLIPPVGVRVECEHGGGWTAGTVIRFPAGVPGVILPFLTTDHVHSNNAYSSWAQWEGGCLVAGAGTRLTSSSFDGTSHGITISGTQDQVSNLYVAGFKGHGFAILGDATIAQTDPLFGSPNLTRGWNNYADGNAGHGFYALGHDANAGCWIGNSAIDNGGWGFYDDSALGNNWAFNHASGNAGALINNSHYSSGPNTDIAASGGGGYCFAPRAGGGNVSRAQGFGNYTEGGGETFLGEYASDFGAIGALTYSGPGSYIGPSGGGEVNNAVSMPSAVFDYNDGSGHSGFLGLNPGPTNRQVLQLQANGHSGIWLVANTDGSWSFLRGLVDTMFRLEPGTTSIDGTVGMLNVGTGFKFGPDGNRWGVNAGAPSSGTFQRGEIVWERNPSASGYVGYVCVVGGTPGTWKGFGQIQA